MKKLSEYLTQLNFDYAITYSGLRGDFSIFPRLQEVFLNLGHEIKNGYE